MAVGHGTVDERKYSVPLDALVHVLGSPLDTSESAHGVHHDAHGHHAGRKRHNDVDYHNAFVHLGGHRLCTAKRPRWPARGRGKSRCGHPGSNSLSWGLSRWFAPLAGPPREPRAAACNGR